MEVVEMATSRVTSWVSYRDLEAQTGASATTLRRFVERFPMFMAGRMVDRKQMFPAESVEVVRRIQQLYAAGKNTADILGILAVERAATIEIRPEEAVTALQRSVDGQNELVAGLGPLAERFVGALEQMAKNQTETLELLRQLIQGQGQAARTMPRQEIERRILAWAEEGFSAGEILTRLKAENVPTVSGRGEWCSHSVKRILRKRDQAGGAR